MNNIKNLFTLYKSYSGEIKLLKIIVLVMINMWLLFIFWKIIALDGVNIINNNIALTKMQTIMGPLLQVLGLDVLNPNTLKMIIISIIVVTSNLAVLYFSQMMAFLILGITARYSYKAYYNYINKDTLNYYGFEKVAVDLTNQEKITILNNFIQENHINDANVIGYLQNKINTLTCSNKNELLLNINNNWLDYKQQILSKIILHQKEQMDQIEIMNKKASSTSWWESIDYWTLLKIGGGIIIVSVIVIGGYSYFNNNSVKAAQDMSEVVLDANKKIADVITQSTAAQNEKINEEIKSVAEKILESNKQSFEVLNDAIIKVSLDQIHLNDKVYKEINNYQEKVIEINNDFNKKIILEQQNFIEEGHSIIEIGKSNNENMSDIIGGLKSINNHIITLTNNVDPIILKTRELDMKINGGNEAINKMENDVIINQIIEYKPLLDEVKEVSDTVGVLTDTVEAILAYLGLDTIRLSERSLNMLLRIREANADQENVQEYRSDDDNPEL